VGWLSAFLEGADAAACAYNAKHSSATTAELSSRYEAAFGAGERAQAAEARQRAAETAFAAAEAKLAALATKKPRPTAAEKKRAKLREALELAELQLKLVQLQRQMGVAAQDSAEEDPDGLPGFD